VGRILALDLGSKRIGLAVSDALGITAQGIPTLHRQNKRQVFEELAKVIRSYEITEIVVGLPLRMSGNTGIQSDKSEAFAEELRGRFGLPVHMFDERLTSAEAHRLLDETEMSDRRRSQVVDQMAASLILQAFLAARTSGGDVKS
jgi:putative holliday junction resolvase